MQEQVVNRYIVVRSTVKLMEFSKINVMVLDADLGLSYHQLGY